MSHRLRSTLIYGLHCSECFISSSIQAAEIMEEKIYLQEKNTGYFH